VRVVLVVQGLESGSVESRVGAFSEVLRGSEGS